VGLQNQITCFSQKRETDVHSHSDDNDKDTYCPKSKSDLLSQLDENEWFVRRHILDTLKHELMH
jgi:hypothetical protein